MMMLKHLLYKEWLKTKWFAFVGLLLNVGTALYIFLDLRHAFLSSGGVVYLSSLLTYKIQYFAIYRYLPVATALLIGLAQYVPEVIDKRIKLALHLPIDSLRLTYGMVGYGFLLLSAIMLPGWLIMGCLCPIYLPAEIIYPSMATVFPWILGGYCTYFLVAMTALEPVWKFRFGYILVGYKLIELFLMPLGYENALPLYPLLIAITCLTSLAPIYTLYRFNKGLL